MHLTVRHRHRPTLSDASATSSLNAGEGEIDLELIRKLPFVFMLQEYLCAVISDAF